MGAQLVEPVRELVFTGPEDAILITLYDGRIMELFGDGLIQLRDTVTAGNEPQIMEFQV